MKLNNKQIGEIGEKLALNFFKKKGYCLLEKNFHCRYGEIDLVFQKEKQISFVEVKTRIENKKGKPYEAVNFWKLKALKRAINYFLLKNKFLSYKLSLEVVSLTLDDNLKLKELKHFKMIDFKN